MIHFFRFRNYRSFQQETLVNMQTAAYKELPEHVAEWESGTGTSSGPRRILKTMAIYGPNASGKSHVISALQFYRDFVCRQLPAPDPETQKALALLSPSPFSADPPAIQTTFPEPAESFDLPMSMCMQFHFHGYLFEYSFTLLKNEVVEEAFLINKKVIFQKEQDQLHPGKLLPSIVKKASLLKIKGPALGTFLSYHSDLFTEANAAFVSFFQQAFLSFDHSCLCRFHQLPSFGSVQVRQILEQSQAADDIRRHLQAMGIPADAAGNDIPSSFAPRTLSTGLTKIILLLYRFCCLQQTGGLLVLDDFTAFLHPNASRYLLQLFQASQNPKLQLIVTTHDTALLNRNQFRRDEVAIVSMDRCGRSHLYTLADIRVRADASFSKDYLAGKYGLVPVWEEPSQL